MATQRTLVNKVGPWVCGNEFWDREAEVSRLIELLDARENILLVAPRRVGKTSLMRETLRQLDVRQRDYGLFVDVQDCVSPEDVVVSISMATRPVQNLWAKILDVFRHTMEELTKRVESIGNDLIKIKLREGVLADWQAKGDRILDELAKADKPLILCLDELPVMLIRLLLADGDNVSPKTRQAAELFLSWLRKNAQMHQGRIRLVICGSIGLEPVARRFGLSGTIAHLRPFHLSPWTREVADGCLTALAENYGLVLQAGVRSAMLDELACYIPHHLQMFFGHVLDDCRSRKNLAPTTEDIVRVYSQYMLGARGHAELADYEERLRRVLGPELQPLALDLLTQAAVTGTLTAKDANILAMSAGLVPSQEKTAIRTVLDVLEHDGYLTRREGADEAFVFVSKLVRDWWRRRFGFGFKPVGERE